jgi:hypothetical protein
METRIDKLKKIDALLSEFKDLSTRDSQYLIGSLRAKNIIYSEEEIKIALGRLLDDKFIDYRQHGNYKITFNGDLFIGYKNKDKLDMDAIQSLSVVRVAAKKYGDRLLCATWTAGIVAAVLLLFQVFCYYFPHYSAYPYHFWFEKEWIYGLKKK